MLSNQKGCILWMVKGQSMHWMWMEQLPNDIQTLRYLWTLLFMEIVGAHRWEILSKKSAIFIWMDEWINK